MPLDLSLPAETKVTDIGSPKHGFMQNFPATGIYDTPGGDRLHDHFDCGTDTQWQSNNSVSRLKMPGIAEVVRSPGQQASDAAKNYEWRNYSLIINNSINGKKLQWGTGGVADKYTHGAIYIDGNGVPWGIAVYVLPQATFEIQVYLQCLFGRFSTYRTFPTSMFKLLAEHEDTGIGYGITTPMWNNNTGHLLTRNSNGSRLFAHLYGTTDNPDYLGTVAPFHCEDATWLRLWGVFDIQISGNGLISEDAETLGNGIAAVVTTYKTVADCKIDVDEGEGYSMPRTVIGKGNFINQIGATVYDTPECPDCSPISPNVTQTFEPSGCGNHYSEELDWEESSLFLFRCYFDINDNVAETSVKIGWESRFDWNCTPGSGTFTVETTYTGDWECIGDPGDNCITDKSSESQSTSINGYSPGSSQLDDYDISGIVFYRNGGEVLDYRQVRHSDISYHQTIDLIPSTVYPIVSENRNESWITTYTVGGDLWDGAANGITAHVYSLDVVGAMVRTRITEGVSEYTLSAVITPNGVDSSQSGTVISRTMAEELIPPPLGGTYQPETLEAIWYEEGITDQGEDHTFSFV